MYKVYIIQSHNNSRYYVGMTANVVDRLKHHNSGATRSTRAGRPWKLIYCEGCADKKNAWLRERQIKKYKGGEAFKKLVKFGEVA